jgi:flagellin
MSRINTNVAALTAQIGLERSQTQLNSTLERLSTGLRINSGADDPAGLIASQGLQSQLAGINQGIQNSNRATNVIATAEGALGEVSSLLLNIKSLVVQSANSGAVSPDEIAANQLQVDSAIASITRISNTTDFNGLQLLNGNLDYLTSGVSSSVIKSLSIAQANFGTNSAIPVQVNVLTSARPAALTFAASAVTKSVTLNITGVTGVSTLTFVSGTKASAIAYAVNQVTDATGVTAAMKTPGNASSGIVFDSTGYGTSNFVSVQAQSGTFNVTDSTGSTTQRAVGVNATATINGALTVGDGLNLTLNSASLNLSMTLDKSFGIGKTSFDITGGGAKFQIGSSVNSNQQINIGIPSIAASSLGNAGVGFLSDLATGGTAALSGGGAEQASNIVDAVISQVATLSGRLGAFEKNTLNTNINSLETALENVTSSNSSITDANFAAETSNLTRAQILVQAGTSVLSTANSTPQSVLKLLGA